jgi:hypothetical protein
MQKLLDAQNTIEKLNAKGVAPTMPTAMPSASPAAGIGVVPSALPIAVPSASPMAASVALTMPSAPGGADAMQAQIDALSDRIRAEKDKEKKAELTALRTQLQRQKRDAGKAEAAAKKEEAERLRAAQLEARAGNAQTGEAARDEINELRDAREEAKEIAKDELEEQIEAIRAQIKLKQLSSEKGNSQIDKLRDAFEHRQRAMDLDIDAQAKIITSHALMAEARTTAALQKGAQAKSTIDTAVAKANALLRGADRDKRRSARESGRAGEAAKPEASPADLAAQARQAQIKQMFPDGTGSLNQAEIDSYLSRAGEIGVTPVHGLGKARSFDDKWNDDAAAMGTPQSVIDHRRLASQAAMSKYFQGASALGAAKPVSMAPSNNGALLTGDDNTTHPRGSEPVTQIRARALARRTGGKVQVSFETVEFEDPMARALGAF